MKLVLCVAVVLLLFVAWLPAQAVSFEAGPLTVLDGDRSFTVPAALVTNLGMYMQWDGSLGMYVPAAPDISELPANPGRFLRKAFRLYVTPWRRDTLAADGSTLTVSSTVVAAGLQAVSAGKVLAGGYLVPLTTGDITPKLYANANLLQEAGRLLSLSYSPGKGHRGESPPWMLTLRREF